MVTTTPYADGSATLVTIIDPSQPWARWKSLDAGWVISSHPQAKKGLVPELLEGVGASNVRVQDEEWRIILAQDFPRKSKRSSGAERFSLDAEGDVDTVLLLGFLQDSNHDFWTVVDGEHDIGNASLRRGTSAT